MFSISLVGLFIILLIVAWMWTRFMRKKEGDHPADQVRGVLLEQKEVVAPSQVAVIISKGKQDERISNLKSIVNDSKRYGSSITHNYRPHTDHPANIHASRARYAFV